MNPFKNQRPTLFAVFTVLAVIAAACGSSDAADDGTAAGADNGEEVTTTTTEAEPVDTEPANTEAETVDTTPADIEPPPVINDGEPTSLAFDSREFAVFGEGPFEVSPVDGDPTAGPSTFLLKVPAGFPGVMHTHEASYRAVVVSGSIRHWHLGENPDEVEALGAGGTWSQQAGVAHQEDNLSDEATIVLLTFDGPFNLDPHEDAVDTEPPAVVNKGEPTSLPFESREFVPFGDSPFEVSFVDGDPTTGPSTFLLKMPAGFPGLMHTHEASYRAVVLSGQVRHWHLGEDPDEVEVLGAGGTWSQQAGVAHQEDNFSDEDTILLITMDGPFDLAPHEEE